MAKTTTAVYYMVRGKLEDSAMTNGTGKWSHLEGANTTRSWLQAESDAKGWGWNYEVVKVTTVVTIETAEEVVVPARSVKGGPR